MEQDVKAQHTPSEAAKRKACDLANAQEPEIGLVWTPEDSNCSTLRALALHLDEVDRTARELRDRFFSAQCPPELEALMLPDPPDPDEELAREVAAKMTPETGQYDLRNYNAALATIKRLREQGRLTDAK